MKNFAQKNIKKITIFNLCFFCAHWAYFSLAEHSNQSENFVLAVISLFICYYVAVFSLSFYSERKIYKWVNAFLLVFNHGSLILCMYLICKFAMNGACWA